MLRNLLSALAVLAAASFARGETWDPSPDGAVVERADVIVVARIQPGTIEYVPHEAKNPSHGRSWEHHVTIDVTRVVKGELTAGEHRVLLHHGLTPCVGGRWKQAGGEINLQDRPEGAIEIVGGVRTLGVFEAPGDLRDENVWLLRRGRAGGPRAAGKEMLGIVDVQDVQPMDRLGYLELYLRDDPEPALRQYIQEHPDDAVRVLPYLQHLAVKRAIAEPDPARRVERLIPYFNSYVLYDWRDEAGEAIEVAGEVAVPYLIALLHDSRRRTEVILKLGRIGSKRAVSALVAVVQESDRMLAGVAKAASSDAVQLTRPGVSRRLHDAASAVYALGLIGDTAAGDVIRKIQATWSDVLPKEHALLDNCRLALEHLKKKRTR
jgi:HEAT repeat protein